MKKKLLPQAEVAYILRRNLGPITSWEDRLADMRNAKAKTYHGLALLPFVYEYSGKRRRPMYRPEDVKNFLILAKEISPVPSDPATLVAVEVDVDPACLVLPWSMRRAKAVGK